MRSYELRNDCHGCRVIDTTIDVKHSINPTFLIHQLQEKKVIIEWECTKKYCCGKWSLFCHLWGVVWNLQPYCSHNIWKSQWYFVAPDKTSMKRVLNILKCFQVPERQLAGSAFKIHSGTKYNNAYFMKGSIIKSSVSRVYVV